MEGLYFIPRLRNNPRVNAENTLKKIKLLRAAAQFNTIIFEGEEVLGNKNYIEDISKIFLNEKIVYGYIEMTGQKGSRCHAKDDNNSILRVHSISQDELDQKSIKDGSPGRFERAVVERGVRNFLSDRYSSRIKTKLCSKRTHRIYRI